MVFEFASTGIGRIAANAGADFVIYDMEHSGWTVQTIRELVASTRAADIVPMVRVPATQYHLLSGPLDVGVMGIMVPMVETEDQARSIIQFAKYPPVGRRGAAFGFAHDDYQPGDVGEKMRSSNAEGMLIAQIETVAGVENCEAIAAVPGIDCLWVGHFDLTNSMGIPGQFTHPEYLAALARVVAACRRARIAAGFMSSSVDDTRWLIAQGFNMVAYSGDLFLFGQALREGLAAVRSNLPAAGL
jgi:2-dehydro-3-deoxyglucarate aldolase/4-hydroxy-2-oxoheptanedioate aldolase